MIYAVGDVHGRLDLLERLHERIEGEIAAAAPADWRIVHLGDLVDRGPDSKGVIERLIGMEKRDARVLSLAGNHDICFLKFLQDAEASTLFKHYGGIDTARSYGVDFADGGEAAFRRNHRRLVEAVPPEHVAFLLALRFSLSFGDFFFCHAGIRPGVPLERQSRDDLIWIRGDFLDAAGLHPKVIVHGHTPVPAPDVRPNRINLDTGAFKTGVLSALAIGGGTTRTLEVRE